MRILNEIGSQARQRLLLVDEDNFSFPLELYYTPTQQAWFFNIEYQGFVLNGQRVVTSPNILRKHETIIPFGILCDTTDNLDPFFIDDFSNGRALLGLLTAEEVARVESDIF